MIGIIINKTAVFKTNHYHHFGINHITASLYGDKVEDIENIKLKVSNNQNIPAEDMNCIEADYWGWYAFNSERFTMIYPQHFLLNMCFPSGIKGAEMFGKGKAYRLELVK